MNKFFKITGIVLVVLFALILVSPLVFQGKIVRIVKEEINKNVNAKVDFGSASLSLIRSFPDFSLRISKLTVIGNAPFENDTFTNIETLRITIDLMSVFRGSPYEIKKIDIRNPILNLLTLKDGSVNWDVAVPEDESQEIEETTGEEEPLSLAIKKLTIKNGRVLYDDRDMDFSLLLEGLDGQMSGSLSTGVSNLMIEATAQNLEMIYEGIAYLSRVKADYKGAFDLDLENDYYTMRNNRVYLNQLGIDVDGGIGFVGDDITMDISFKSRDDNFKNLLSLVPAIYARDFAQVRTDGRFALSGHVKGLYGDVAMPGFGLDLKVDGASFSYPDLPESIREIFIAALITNKSGDLDDTKVAIDRFDFMLAGNPVKTRFYLKTPMSDPDIDAAFSGKIDLASLSKAIPLEPEETLTGLIDFNARFAAKISDVENSRFNNITAEGFLEMKEFDYKTTAIALPVEIQHARFNFSPAFLNLANLDMTLGRSQMQITGRVDNYLAYYLGEGYLTGNLNLNADILDVNQILGAMPADTTAIPDTSSMVFQVPDLPEKIDFVLNAKAAKILYDSYDLNNAAATIRYKDKMIRFDPLKAGMLAGNIEMSGLFDARNNTAPFIDLDFRISNFDIPQAYFNIGMLQQVAPVAEKTKGTFSTGFKLRGKLDQELNPSYETFQGGGSLQTSQLVIEAVKVMEQLAGMLGNEEYKRLVTDGLNFSFEILNGKVFQKPFNIRYGGTNTTLGGSIGFDQQLNYDMVFQIPYEKLGVNQTVKNLTDAASRKGININPGSNLNVNAKLTGLVTNPKIELDYKTVVGNLKSELEDAARRELQKQKEEALKKLSEEAEKILSDARAKADELIAQAERTAATIRSEAATAAEKLRQEAANQAQRLENEGKSRGMIAEMAAKESAKKVRSEGDNAAQRVIREADNRAESLVNQAKTQADEIMRRAREHVDRL